MTAPGRMALAVAITLSATGLALGTSAAPAAAAAPGSVEISEFMASNATTALDNTGTASDWIELHNTTTDPVDLTGWALTDTVTKPAQWVFPTLTLAPGGYLVVWPTGTSATTGELHTNFKLSATGEYLGLRDPAGTVIDEYAPTFPVQYTDISYGRSGTKVGYFPTATPGAPNGSPYAGFVTGTVSLSVPHGVYTSAQQVTMTTDQAGATIRYTTDGSTPSETNGTSYAGPVTVASTTTLRATPVVAGFKPGKVTTASYVFPHDVVAQGSTPPANFPTGPVNGQVLDYGLDSSVVTGHEAEVEGALTAIPTISVVTDAANLFDPTTGIYVNAKNKGSAWERPASLEVIDPSGAEPGFSIDSGIRIKGGDSRNSWFPKHSFKFAFGPQYGGTLNYPLFGTSGASTFTSVELKCDQSWSWAKGTTTSTLMRDIAYRQTRAALGLPTPRSRYYHVYLNGQYWGIYYTQEEVTAQYAATYLGGSAANYDVITDDRDLGFAPSPEDGTMDAWNAMYPLIADRNVTDAEYAALSAQVDLNNLIDTYLVEAYTANEDGIPSWWLADYRGNNWAAMRDRTGGKWTFTVDDAEASYAMRSRLPDLDRVGPFTAFDKTFPESTLFHPGWLHEALMTNAQYRSAFVARGHALLSDPTSPLGSAASRTRWTAQAAALRPAILGEAARWADFSGQTKPTTTDWEHEVSWVDQNWFDQRPALVETQIRHRVATNRALGAAATLSSTYSPTTLQARDAVDGVLTQGFAASAYEAEPYWQVDLGGWYDLSEVALWNRTDCCQDRMTNVHVLTSTTPIVGRSLAAARAQSGVTDHVVSGSLSTLASLPVGDQAVRFIRVQLPTTGYLQLAEFAAYGTPTPLGATGNLALGASASQSTTAYGGDPARAIDGNTSGAWFDLSVSHTAAQAQPWWQVDLGALHRVDTVTLYNRTDCCGARLANVHVLASATPITGTTLAAAQAQPGVSDYLLTGSLSRQTLAVIGRTARYVRIQLEGTDYLSLAEVQVNGLVPPVGNVAQGRTATQSGTTWGGPASRGVDGNTDGNFWANSVTSSDPRAQPWWQVDLGSVQNLSSVFLWNRTDCCTSRLADVHVFASVNPITGTTLDEVRAGPGVTEKVLPGVRSRVDEVTGLGSARYIRVMLEGTNFLSLAEVQAFAATG